MGISIRILGIDAPEMISKNKCDREIAAKAKFLEDQVNKIEAENRTKIAKEEESD